MEKVPNWLRYIIAIPGGILGSILAYCIVNFSNLWIASPDSLMIKLWAWVYGNGVGILIALYFMDLILPKYKVQFNITLSLLYGALIVVAFTFLFLGITTYTWGQILGGIFNIVCLICFNVYAFKHQEELNADNKEQNNNN